MAGFPLTGIDPLDPSPGTVREIRFLQGATSGSGSSRDVLLMGNCTSGSTTVDNAGNALNTLSDPISDEADMVTRYGLRSELVAMYRSYIKVDPNATIYTIAIPEGTSATASVATITFV